VHPEEPRLVGVERQWLLAQDVESALDRCAHDRGVGRRGRRDQARLQAGVGERLLDGVVARCCGAQHRAGLHRFGVRLGERHDVERARLGDRTEVEAPHPPEPDDGRPQRFDRHAGTLRGPRRRPGERRELPTIALCSSSA